MKTIAIDIQPQRTYSELCPLELPIAGAIDIVKELNHQASLADYRVLVKDSHAPNDLQLRKLSQPDLSSSINKSHAVIGTEGFQLLPGLLKLPNRHASTIGAQCIAVYSLKVGRQ